jgi:hypothetical protein
LQQALGGEFAKWTNGAGNISRRDRLSAVALGGGNLFFQLVNACYERCTMIMTGNRGSGEWAEIFGHAVVGYCALGASVARRPSDPDRGHIERVNMRPWSRMGVFSL